MRWIQGLRKDDNLLRGRGEKKNESRIEAGKSEEE
jgi:hypothetical protein